MSVLAIVPARGGSRRLKGKNALKLGGQSLLGWAAKAAYSETHSVRRVLSTDDVGLAALGVAEGLEVPRLRPSHLATDNASTVDVVRHVLDDVLTVYDEKPDFLAVLQPTSPFRRRGLLDEALSVLIENPSINSVVTVSELHVPASHVYTKSNSLINSIAPNADSDHAFLPSGGLYLVRTTNFWRELSLFCQPVFGLSVAGPEKIDIDHLEDFMFAEKVIEAGLWVE